MLQTKVLYQRGLFLEAPGSLTTQPVSCLPTRAQRAWDGASVRGNTAVLFYSVDVLFYLGFRHGHPRVPDNTFGKHSECPERPRESSDKALIIAHHYLDLLSD